MRHSAARGFEALWLAIVVVGCGTQERVPATAAAPGPPAAAPSPEPSSEEASVSSESQSADGVVAAALAETSRIRELPAKHPVRGVSLSRAEMAARVRLSIEREIPPEVIAAQGELLIALGVVPASFDYLGAVVTLMTSELAGYYEPAEKTMYLASDLGHAEAYATLAHELVHALQDQHYGLGRLLEYRPDEGDAQTAVHALAEGDATSAMLDQLLQPRGGKATDLSDELIGVQVRAASQLSSATGDVPDILKRSLVAPYVDGITLVHWLRRRGGWAEVDRAWNAPPASTEQLLHPEKFLAHEAPLAVASPLSDSPTAKSVYTDVVGEQAVRLLLEEWLPRGPSVRAAAGWGGDRVTVFRDETRVSVAWHLRYDDTDGATRGAGALRRAVEAQGGLTGASCVERPDRGPLLVQQKGHDIAVVAGPYVRQSGTATSASSCSNAGRWALRIVAQR